MNLTPLSLFERARSATAATWSRHPRLTLAAAAVVMMALVLTSIAVRGGSSPDEQAAKDAAAVKARQERADEQTKEKLDGAVSSTPRTFSDPGTYLVALATSLAASRDQSGAYPASLDDGTFDERHLVRGEGMRIASYTATAPSKTATGTFAICVVGPAKRPSGETVEAYAYWDRLKTAEPVVGLGSACAEDGATPYSQWFATNIAEPVEVPTPQDVVASGAPPATPKG